MDPATEPRERSFYRWPKSRTVGWVAMAMAFVWATQIAASSWRSVRQKPKERTIKVTGSAKKRIVSDWIQWEALLESRASDRTAAYRSLSEQRRRAVAFLEAQGIKPNHIQPQSASFEEVFETVEEVKVLPGLKEPLRTQKKVPKGFVTRQAILVRSPEVSRVERASREITSLLEQGVSVTSEAPSYFYSGLGALKIEMLAAAGRDARARAENIIKSAGGAAIGKLVVADMGIININPANSTQTSEEGNNDKTSLEKDIITIVHAEFALED